MFNDTINFGVLLLNIKQWKRLSKSVTFSLQSSHSTASLSWCTQFVKFDYTGKRFFRLQNLFYIVQDIAL